MFFMYENEAGKKGLTCIYIKIQFGRSPLTQVLGGFKFQNLEMGN